MKKVSSFVIGVCLVVAVLLGSCTSDLLETIEEDIADQREKEALEEEEGKTAETRKPVITLFAWQNVTGGTTNNPTVGFACASEAKAVSTSGAATIAGYYLSQTATAPAVDAAGWVATQPESFSFPPVNGAQTVYLWVKDSFGNVSDSSPLSITLAPLSLSWNAFYVDGMMVPAHEVFLLSAAEPLSADDASVSGAGSGTVVLSGTGNQSISVSPASRWSAGAQSITLSVKTAYGLTATVSRDFSIFNGVCVSSAGGGSDGTAREPISTLPAGIAKANELYPGAGEVRISQGEYTTNWNGNTNRITLIDGISLYGGYNPAWTARDIDGYPVVIRDESDGGGATAAESNRAIDIPDSITDITFVDGVSVYGGGGEHSTAIFSAGSPKIQNCKLFAGSTGGAGDYRYGFYASAGTSELTLCTINDGSGGNSSVERTCGIYTESGSSISVSKCKISGGTANAETYGLFGAGALVEKSEIDGGSATLSGMGISIQYVCDIEIRNNIFRSAAVPSNTTICNIFILSASSVIIRNNTFILEDAGDSTNITGYGVWIYDRSAIKPITIENNLFAMNEGSSPCDIACAVYKQNTEVDPESLSNNGFSGFENTTNHHLYGISSGTAYTKDETVALNALSFTKDNVYGSAVMDFNKKLTSGSQDEFINGGIDGSIEGWGFSDDFFNTQRTGNGTTGWSVGFSEF